MLMNMRRDAKGVTLIEMMLVLVVAASMIIMLVGYLQQKAKEIRRDKVTLQIQEVLNAGLAYYVTFGKWPSAGITTLQTTGYLPTGSTNNPWGQAITSISTPTGNVFTVTTKVMSTAESQIVAARFAFGSYAADVVSAQVTIPAQNLNNARSVNYGSLYHSGGCVPVPTCPTGMVPDIFVVPAAVSGVYDAPSCAESYSAASCTNSSGGAPNVYPVSAFTAYAVGPAAVNGTSVNGPPACTGNPGPPAGCATWATGTLSYINDSNTYWRVCLSVLTEKGLVAPTGDASSPAWGQMVGSVMAITRCMPSPGDNPAGSDFTVWSP